MMWFCDHRGPPKTRRSILAAEFGLCKVQGKGVDVVGRWLNEFDGFFRASLGAERLNGGRNYGERPQGARRREGVVASRREAFCLALRAVCER